MTRVKFGVVALLGALLLAPWMPLKATATATAIETSDGDACWDQFEYSVELATSNLLACLGNDPGWLTQLACGALNQYELTDAENALVWCYIMN